MKIISGRLKNRPIPTIKNPKYRPSTGKFKEALFSALGSMEEDIFLGKRVLDLFSGTGSLGFECLSRGADHVTLVDIESDHIKVTKEFAITIGEVENMAFIRLDATNLPESYGEFDIVLMDPPYYKALAIKTLKSLQNKLWLSPNAIIAIEIEKNEELVIPEGFDLISDRIIGKARLIIVRYNDAI